MNSILLLLLFLIKYTKLLTYAGLHGPKSVAGPHQSSHELGAELWVHGSYVLSSRYDGTAQLVHP